MSILVFAGSLTRPAPNYAEANGRGLTTLSFDAASGQLEIVGELTGIDDTSWLSFDAARRRLYAVCEVPGTDQSWVAAFAVAADGRLSELNRQPTAGQTACHMSFSRDGRFLIIANYNAVVPAGAPDGAVEVLPIGADGRLGPAVASVRHVGSGPNPDRQERSHAHCAVPSPDGRFVYVADLGMDRIFCYALGADGSLTHRETSDFVAPPGLGPRHLVFSADGRRLFMVSELIATVMSLSVDPVTGALAEIDRFPIAQTGSAIVQPAGILLTADGRHLFAGLRVCDEIIGLAVDAATGRLSQSGRWPCGGATPRDFLLSPDERHLIVANQDADRLSVFTVADGLRSGPVQQLGLGTPMALALAMS